MAIPIDIILELAGLVMAVVTTYYTSRTITQLLRAIRCLIDTLKRRIDKQNDQQS